MLYNLLSCLGSGNSRGLGRNGGLALGKRGTLWEGPPSSDQGYKKSLPPFIPS
jgi:hypothetical protein